MKLNGDQVVLLSQYVNCVLCETGSKLPLRNLIRQLLVEHDDKVKIKTSPIHGVGVFATRDIPADTNLGPAQIRQSTGRYQVTDLGKYHNHSYEPTCYNKKIGDTRYLHPHRDLVPGDEITIDYTLQDDLEQPELWWE